MQIPIINGIYTNEDSDFRTSYPINLVPVPKAQGISQGYLRPHDGMVSTGSGPGVSRGGVNWDETCYRVMGDQLVREDENGLITPVGAVTSGGQVTLDYSFKYLGITSGGNFFLYDKVSIQQVTDPDLGNVISHIWVDGYFLLTDGEFIIATDLNDPFSINPLRFGSAEADPDPILALLKLRNEPYALNRYTIEVFDNIGGSGFPFQRVDGAQIQKGTIGTHACAVFMETVAFVGGGRNESIAVWMARSGNSTKISTREIDQILEEYDEQELSRITVDVRVDKGHQHFYIHLPNQTLVYDGSASQIVGQPVWFILRSCISCRRPTQFRGKDFVWCYNKWLVADPKSTDTGKFANDLASHWGDVVGWEFGTIIIYNESNGAIFHELELVVLAGRVKINGDTTIFTDYSLDGEIFSTPKRISLGSRGRRNRRLVWLMQGNMKNWRVQRFYGTSEALLSFARLQARIEPLVV